MAFGRRSLSEMVRISGDSGRSLEGRSSRGLVDDSPALPVRSRARVVAACVAAGALGLSMSACSSDEKVTGTDSQAALVSPLMEAIGLAGAEYQEFESTFLAEHEKALATCMTEAGFEYYEAAPLQVNAIASKEDSLATAKESGYGISNDSEGVSFAEDDSMTRLYYYSITTEQSEANQAAYDEALAKNDEYLASLSDDDLAAYNLARDGEASGDDYTVDEDGNLIASDEIDPDHMGCESALADSFVDPAQDVLDSDEYADTVDAILNFYTESDTQDSIKDVYSKWAACYTKATGESAEVPSDVTDALDTEFSDLFADVEGLDTEDDESALDEYLLEQEESGYEGDIEIDQMSFTSDESATIQTVSSNDPEATESADDETELELTDEELAELGLETSDDYDDSSAASEYGVDEEEYNALVTRESTLAQADVTCRFETDYFNSIQLAQIKLEEEFVKDNKDALTALGDAIREARAAA